MHKNWSCPKTTSSSVETLLSSAAHCVIVAQPIKIELKDRENKARRNTYAKRSMTKFQTFVHSPNEMNDISIQEAPTDPYNFLKSESLRENYLLPVDSEGSPSPPNRRSSIDLFRDESHSRVLLDQAIEEELNVEEQPSLFAQSEVFSLIESQIDLELFSALIKEKKPMRVSWLVIHSRLLDDIQEFETKVITSENKKEEDRESVPPSLVIYSNAMVKEAFSVFVFWFICYGIGMIFLFGY